MAGRTKRFAAALGLVAFCTAGITAAADAPLLPEGWIESVVNERSQRCDMRGLYTDVERLLVACGRAGVWEVKFEGSQPRFVRSYEFHGSATGFFVDNDGRIWVKLEVEQAQPLDRALPPQPIGSQPPAAPPAPVAAPAPAAPSASAAQPQRPSGRVVGVQPGAVLISLGSADGISRSDRIELSLEQREDLTDSEVAVSKEALAVGVVVNVAEHHAKVRIGINEEVPIGAVAVPTRAPTTASLSGPPRVGSIWEVEFTARPFVAIGELGGGLLLSGGVSRRMAGNFRLGAVVDPLGLGDAENQVSIGTANAAVFASFDSQYLEMGLGFGAQTVNMTDFGLDPGSGLTVAQIIRLGAEDGLNLSARTSIALFHKEFDFGGMVATAQIPVSRGYWLLLGGGGGNVGYGYGELGLRVMLKGNGGAGSNFLTATAGGAGVFRSDVCRDIDFEFTCDVAYGGPMAGIGYEWRL